MGTDSKTNGFKPLEDQTVNFDDDEQVLWLAQLAVADALREHKERGQYIVTWKDGKIVRVPPEEIVVPEIETPNTIR